MSPLAIVVIASMILVAIGLLALGWSACVIARRSDDLIERANEPKLPVLVVLDEIEFDWPKDAA